MTNYTEKQGFTLAEVLITLGIIGIVAAMTIPALMANISDRKNSAMLKEDYSILKQMMLLANDAGAVASFPKSDDMQQMKNWFETFVQPHIKTTEVCYNRWGCWNKDVKTSNGSKYQGNTICGNRTVSFIMTNGSFVCMDDAGDGRFGVLTNGATTMVMLVDLNGDKQPNVIGKDIFAFALKDDQLLPGGYDMTEQQINQNCSLTGSGSYAGTYCTVKAARQNFKLPVLK